MWEHISTRGSDHLATGRGHRRYRPLLMGLLIGVAACAGFLFPLGVGGGQNTVALACGIGAGPTMEANKTLALLQPVTKNVSDTLPIGVFSLNYLVGRPITFTEDMSADPSAPPLKSLQMQWLFGDGSTGKGISPQHSYTKPGTYNVYAQFYSDGWQTFDSAQIHVVPSAVSDPPVVKVTTSGTVIGPGGVISFDASGSHAQDGSKLTYLWNFNDGFTATGPVVKHAFPSKLDTTGKWFVGLTVTDGRGASTFTAVNIQIVAQLPSAALTSNPTTIGTGGIITFDASGSTPPSLPAGDQIVSYQWNFGDGTPTVTTTAPTTTHKFTRAGTFSVTVQAIDQQGAPGTKSLTITVVAVTGNSGLPPWLMYGGIGLLLVVLIGGAYLLYAGQRRRAALIREQEAAMQLARMQRVRPGPPSQGPYPPRSPGPAPVSHAGHTAARVIPTTTWTIPATAELQSAAGE